MIHKGKVKQALAVSLAAALTMTSVPVQANESLSEVGTEQTEETSEVEEEKESETEEEKESKTEEKETEEEKESKTEEAKEEEKETEKESETEEKESETEEKESETEENEVEVEEETDSEPKEVQIEEIIENGSVDYSTYITLESGQWFNNMLKGLDHVDVDKVKNIKWATSNIVLNYSAVTDEKGNVRAIRDDIPLGKNYTVYEDGDWGLYAVAAATTATIDKDTKDVIYDTIYITSNRAAIQFRDGDASHMFDGMRALSKIEMLDRLDVKTFTNTSYMFRNCRGYNGSSIPGNFLTYNVTDMSHMFEGTGAGVKKGGDTDTWVVSPSALSSKAISIFDTSKVRDFSYMFSGAELRDTFDISNFSSASATDMNHMFSYCTKVKGIKWDKNKFTMELADDISYLFAQDYNIEVLDLGGVSLKPETKITGMVQGMEGLKAINTFKVSPNESIPLPSNFTYQDITTTIYKNLGGQVDTPTKSTWIGTKINKIRFEGNRDEDSTMEQQLYIDGAIIPLNTNTFTYKGYKFKGWDTAETAKTVRYADEAIVAFKEENTTLYAVWEKNTYNLTFNHLWDSDANGIEDTEIVEVEFNGQIASLPESRKSGYDVRWYTQKNGRGTQIKANTPLTFNRDTNVYAYYVSQTFNVDYDANGGTGEMTQQLFANNISQFLNKNQFTRPGYTFVGWDTRKNTSTSTATAEILDQAEVMDLAPAENSDVKLYAHWIADNTKGLNRIEYNLKEGFMREGNRYVYLTANKEDIRIGQPERENAEFIGWSGDGIDVISRDAVIKAGSSGDVYLESHWSDEFYRVTFLADGKEFETSDRLYGDKVDVPVTKPTKTDGTFQGWYTEDGIKYNFDTPITKDITLKAKFSMITNKSGIESELVEVGGKINMVKNQTYKLEPSSWTSSNRKFVTVDKKGNLRAIKAGTATITNGVDKTYEITVYDPKLDQKTMQLQIGEHKALNLLDAPEEYVTSWVSSNPAIVQVIDGEIYAIGTGSAKITAYMNGRSYPCTVKVVSLNTVKTAYEETQDITLYINQSVTPKYNKPFKLDGNKTTVEISNKVNGEKAEVNKSKKIYDNGIIRVNGFKITALSSGDATVTYVYQGVKKKVNVHVITLVNKKDVYLNEGKTFAISTPGVPATKITWESDNAAIATVSKTKVKAIAKGDTVIRGDYKGNKYIFNLHVTTPGITDDEFIAIQPKKKNAYSATFGIGTSYAILPTDTNQSIIWKSSNAKVASVDSYGIIRTKAKGKANISASINGQTVIIAVKVVEGGVIVPESSDFNYKTIVLGDGSLVARISKSGRVYVEYR